MARRIVSITTLTTPTAYADTVALTDATYPFLVQGAGAATQVTRIWEISIAGQAAATSSPTFMILSRDSTLGATANTMGAGQTDAPLDPGTAALAAPVLTGNTNATVKPQRSSTLHLANCSLNAFGGNYFWRANRMEECFSVLSTTQPYGESSLSAFTGGTPGAIGCHLIYETL